MILAWDECFGLIVFSSEGLVLARNKLKIWKRFGVGLSAFFELFVLM